MPEAFLNRPQDPSLLVIALGLTRESSTITPAPTGGKNRRGREQGGVERSGGNRPHVLCRFTFGQYCGDEVSDLCCTIGCAV